MMGPKEKKERALGERLHLKGTRCDSPKCAAVRRPYPPGVHGKSRRRTLSDFGRQIKEKQKFKLTYLIDERNLSRIFAEAQKKSGTVGVGAKFLELLERRIDNVVYRLGLAPSRLMGRQLVLHGHVFINGKRTRSPGFEVKANDVITIRKESMGKGPFRDIAEKMKTYELPSWLTLDAEKLEGRVKALPENTEMPFEISLLVEAFSK